MGPGDLTYDDDTLMLIMGGASQLGMGAVDAPSATPGFPTSGDSRQLDVNNPAQIRVDAAMLRDLNYPAPDTGNAYDPRFRAAVAAFQTKAGLDADGLIGPNTRGALQEIHGTLAGGGSADLGGGGGGGLLNVHTADGSLDTKKIALLGGGALLVLGGLYWFATR